MIDISSVKEKNIQNFVKIIVSHGAHLNKKIILKEIYDNNVGFVALDEIGSSDKIISIPRKLLISKDVFKDFLFKKKINCYDEKLINSYFSILPNLNFFKQNNFYFLNNEDKKKALSFFKSDSPIKKTLTASFEKFNNLENDHEKYTFLLFKTRSFKVNNEFYLTPLLDSMNFNFYNKSYSYDNVDVYINSEKKLIKNDEVFQSYNLTTDPINFYIHYSFFPLDYKNITFSKNQFIINASKNVISKVNEKFWNINNNQTISNKNAISFYNYELPLIIDLMFESLTNDKKNIAKVIINFLLLVKNQFNIEELNLYLKNVKQKKEPVLSEFAKSIKLYCYNLDKIIEKLQ